jgi:transcription antitermination factor NusG
MHVTVTSTIPEFRLSSRDYVADAPPWFGVHARAKSEFVASHELCLRGFECFLPVHKVKRRWSDRVKILDTPLFPGYLFCRFAPSERLRVLNSPGVAQIVGFGGRPAPIDEGEIRSVQMMVASRIALTPWPCAQVGQAVRIERGPLAGVEGIVTRADDGKTRVTVSVSLLNRAVSAEVEQDWIEIR